MKQFLRRSKRTVIGILGGLIVLIGIVMIPYPGPGWLVVFLGLGVLATEFRWARSLLYYARAKYRAWQQWVKNQPLVIRLLLWSFTGLVVVITIWLVNGYGMIDAWLDLGQDWLHSPITALEFLEH